MRSMVCSIIHSCSRNSTTLCLPRNSPVILGILLAFMLAPQVVLAQEEVTVMLPGDVPMVLVKVPAGTFMMGSPQGERGNFLANETLHQVTLTKDYYLGKTEVSQAQWEAVMGTAMPASCANSVAGDNYAVHCLTWNMIAGPGGFVEKLNELIGTIDFRLPTEAEWERAARADTSTRFSHGDVLECGDDCEACATHDTYMWWCGNNDPLLPKMVGLKQANPFGLHDMHGNLWEFVNDLYTDDLGSGPVTDPTGPSNNSNGDIVMRGGGAEAWINRSASRIGGAADNRNQTSEIGFRIAKSTLDGLGFQINPGLNDAWFYPPTNGQGFFVNVWEDIGQVFIGWFTSDVMRPPEDVEAILGEPGHRWITAQGPYSGDTATLDVYVSSGGIFDSEEPPVNTPDNPPVKIGTMEITWTDCNTAEVRYDLTSPERSGVIPIERITLDNIALCEALAGQ